MVAEQIRDTLFNAAFALLKRENEEADPEDVTRPEQNEKYSSFALFISIMLVIIALFTSYMLQQRKIQAVHETVLSIFAGMVVGLIVRISGSTAVQSLVSFDYQLFFNLLLPPIILASGYELHQANFFRNIGPILTFAFAGTFISALVLGIILWLWTWLPFDFDITFVEAFSIGATLSATDPVTILAIFNAYKVDPKLYTIIFGESILNDAIAIVLFETAQKYIPSGSEEDAPQAAMSIVTLFEAIGIFLLIFFGSLIIGVAVGILTTLGLKFTHVRRNPKTESCLVILIAYASYFFANSIGMSGIVSLLFCGITLKHYAYYNMSRRTQLTTKFVFQVLAQLSENFIFIYLGMTLSAEDQLVFKPLFILVTMFGICAARYLAVFPLSKLINWTIRFRARRSGGPELAEELPRSYQVMLFWAGLRGAVGVALAAGLKGNKDNIKALQATVLVVVVLTVIIFGGTTARMLEIMGIKTGVVDEVDSDDEFDIEIISNGTYYKRGGTSIGGGTVAGVSLGKVDSRGVSGANGWDDSPYSSGSNKNVSPPMRGKRQNSTHSQRERERDASATNLLAPEASEEDLWSDSDLPPAAPRRSPKRRPSPPPSSSSVAGAGAGSGGYPTSGTTNPSTPTDPHLTASGAIRDLFTGTEETATWFKRLDDGIIKPTLLLDQGGGGNGGHGVGGGGGKGGGGGQV